MPKKRNEALIRVFDSGNKRRLYHYCAGYPKKSDAKRRAKRLRKRGDRARVVKGSRGWEVWQG